jgi:hypothetical protein
MASPYIYAIATTQALCVSLAFKTPIKFVVGPGKECYKTLTPQHPLHHILRATNPNNPTSSSSHSKRPQAHHLALICCSI